MEPASVACQSCGWERPKRGEIQTVEGTLIDFELSTKALFQPRKGLRAACLNDPRAILNAALSYTSSNSSKGPEHARRWAAGIWKGIYERWPPRSFEGMPVNPSQVTAEQWALIEREVKRFRKNNKRAA